MRRITVLIATLSFAMSGLVFSPAQAAVPSDGTYLCTTGAPSTSTPNYTITGGVVSAGGSCVEDVVITDGVTSIEEYAFDGSGLTSITLPAGLVSIGNGSFSGTGSLASITIPASVTSIGNYAFRFAGLTSITVDSANANFTSTSGVLFNKASTTIIAYPSKKVASSYSIPDGVTSISDMAFSDASLTSITIPETVTSIGSLAFESADITSITIPASVTSIGDGAFENTSSLSSITVDSANVDYSSIGGVLFNESATTLIAYPANKNVTTYSIPSSVKSIESAAFLGAALTSITIPETVTSIGSWAFLGAALTSVTIPSGVTSIGHSTFYGAPSLTTVTIPASVTSIGGGAFGYALSLSNVYFLGDAPANVGTTPFVGTAVGARAYITPGASGFGNPGSIWNGLIVTLAGPTTLSDGTYLCTTGAPSSSTPNFTITNGVVSAGGSCAGDVVIPEGVTSIGGEAFLNATSMTSISIPASVTNIGIGLRETGLTRITVAADNQNFSSPTTGPDAGVLFNKAATAIVVYPKAKAGSSYSIPESVTSIGPEAFGSATALTSITIHSGVTSIANSAFRNSGLTSFTVSEDNQNFSSPTTGLDTGVLFNKASTELIHYPNERDATFYSIPNTVTSIGVFAFELTDLTSINIPETVTSIGSNAFENADITSITIPSSVTSIESFTFLGAKFTSITIPASVTSIGNYAFFDAASLSNVYFLGDAPETVGTTPFLRTASGAKAVIKSGASGFGSPGSIWNGLIVTLDVVSEVTQTPTPTPIEAEFNSPDVLAKTGVATPFNSLGAIGLGLLAILLGSLGLRRRNS